MEKLGEDKVFYKKMVIIGIPVVCQNLISIGLNLIDTLMIGMLGEKELAAVGAANQIYLIYTVSLFGLFSGAAVYTAQYWGAKNMAGIKRVLGIDYMIALIFAAAVTIITYILAPQIIGLFSKDEAVIKFGVQYIRIASLSYPIAGISMSISYNSRAIQWLKLPTTINAMALVMNAVLNYILIFGKFGAPVLGVRGAAIATLTARIFELLALMTFVYTRKEHPFKATFAELTSFTKALFGNVMRTAVPVVFTEGSWALSVALIYAAYGKIGTSALAVAQVASVVCDLLQCIYFGVGNATAMLIGETLGQGDKERAYIYGRKAIRIVLVLNVVITAIMVAVSKPIVGIYNFDAETSHLLYVSLLAMAVTITPKMLGYLPLVGILRAGGDTVFCMKLELFANMCIAVPIAYIGVMALGLSLPVVMILIELSDVFRIVISLPRFKSRKWINIVI